MGKWPSTKASRVLSALQRIGWKLKRTTGSHRVLERAGWPDYVFPFHGGDEIGPAMLGRIAKHTGLQPRGSSSRRGLKYSLMRWKISSSAAT